MTLERGIARAFAMDEAAWRRHASPWSVWTRVATLPLWILAVWSRAWIGRWAVAPVALLALWTWWNPRLFPAPASTDNWASKGVMGERVWLDRDRVAIPRHHRLVPRILAAVAAIGGILLIWGLAELAIWPTLLGMALAFLGKLWFVDRMVWLYEDMKDATPEYRGWASPADDPPRDRGIEPNPSA
ncbi:DUF6653 family protein [Tundrisphaera sp. TA3]|uniref:DUF6653 family protein n=1 Tax=Tundrisphaera sp. TA3 TaxID=3435775 RepID=UPI003EB79243